MILDSAFIEELIEKWTSKLVLVIQSKDNKFFNLKLGQNTINIPKSRISLIKEQQFNFLFNQMKKLILKKIMILSSFYEEY